MNHGATDRLVLATLFTVASAACSGSDNGPGIGSPPVGGSTSLGTTGGQPIGSSALGGAASGTGGNSAGPGGTSSSSPPTIAGGATSATSAAGTSETRGGATVATGGTGKGGANTSGSAIGGKSAGGAANGGASGTVVNAGGASTSGASAYGGASGGTGRGGSTSRGGAATGGAATGGAATGGAATGGASVVGGTNSGGNAMGGAATGGSAGACTPIWGEPPANVAAWINESWNSELGTNIKNRKAWLLDSVILGKGQVNLCVRWGATSAPSTAVKTNMAAAVQLWFNDWFSQLAGYACFPYSTIVTKVTGWAVRSANTSWVSDLGSDVRIYTETDSEGEPKCSDACSFFTQSNWNHSFPNCQGGEAFHHDYWLWLDDTIGGGAAAVGGDWGLRMPVANFVSAMNKSNSVIEHEMGHGFGFQDYYSWSGSKPTGGSLMIVGSANSQTPTTGDQWLLRRTWREMKSLRSW